MPLELKSYICFNYICHLWCTSQFLNVDTVSVCTACEINVKKHYACIYLIRKKKVFIVIKNTTFERTVRSKCPERHILLTEHPWNNTGSRIVDLCVEWLSNSHPWFIHCINIKH